jgi:preprotein translocase subunit YajC
MLGLSGRLRSPASAAAFLTMLTHTFASSLIIAQAAPAGPSNPLMSILPLGLMFVAMYFFLIAPQRKKQKELQKQLDALQTGDEVLTAGGIYGVVTNRKDDRVVLRISDDVKVEVAKAFIQAVVKKTDAK